MDRAMILNHLNQAHRHVAEGARQVAEQRERVQKLERDGDDTRDSRLLLKQFEELLALHIADRERLERELFESTVLLHRAPSDPS